MPRARSSSCQRQAIAGTVPSMIASARARKPSFASPMTFAAAWTSIFHSTYAVASAVTTSVATTRRPRFIP
jgi:hypothetical protein